MAFGVQPEEATDSALAAEIRRVVREELAAALTPVNAWVSVAAAAAEIGVKPRVLVDDARRGRLEIGSAGRRRVISRTELTRYLKSRPVKVAVANVVDERADAKASIARTAARLAR